MTREERKIALHCLKAYSDYHSEVCEECINYPNCDHTMQDDVTETIIKALEQEPVLDKIKGYINHIRNTGLGKKKSLEFIEKFIDGLKSKSEE